MRTTLVCFDRTIVEADHVTWNEYKRVVLVRCSIRSSRFSMFEPVIAVDCRFERADMYGGMLWGCAFVRSSFVESDLGDSTSVSHFHACTFTNSGTFYKDDAYLNVHFTDCTFVNSRVPRVMRGHRDDGWPICSPIESHEHRLARIDYIKRHTRNGNFLVAEGLSIGVPLLDHAVHADKTYSSQELCERDLAPGWAVLVDCEFADIAVNEIGVDPVFVGCVWRRVVVGGYWHSGAVFVECEFDDVVWSCSFAETQFVRCTFRRCHFATALDKRPESLDDDDDDDDDFEVTFEDCVFELCEPPTLR